MCIRYNIEKMFLKMFLRVREDATSVTECLDKFPNVYLDVREHFKIKSHPFGKSVAEYLLHVSYEEEKGAHVIGTSTGCLIMENHR